MKKLLIIFSLSLKTETAITKGKLHVLKEQFRLNFKSALLICLFAITVQVCISQNRDPEIISSSGNSTTNTTGSISWTLGEPLIETASSEGTFLTGGFQQPSTILISTIDEANNASTVTAYPNPFESSVSIVNSEDSPLFIEVIDITGKVLLKKQISGSKNILDLSMFNQGMYFLNVYRDKNRIKTIKLNKI